jgi:hypothetical protein
MAIFSALGGLIGQGGANQNAAAIEQATREATAANEAQRDFNYSQASPWISGGRSALDKIGQILGFGTMVGEGGDGGGYSFTGDYDGAVQKNALKAFQTTPGYQFRRDEGVKTLDRSAASRGMTLSGAQIKGVQEFGDNLANQEFDSYVNRLMGVAGMGNQSQAGLSGTNSGLTASSSNNMMQGGVARGSAYQSGANALASGIMQGGQNLLAGGYMFRKPLGLT